MLHAVQGARTAILRREDNRPWTLRMRWQNEATMSEINGNGGTQSRFLWWVVGSIFAPLTLALTGTVLNLGITSAQRISTLEAQFHELHQRLELIDRKLDRILDARK
jgi:hypothetical protein